MTSSTESEACPCLSGFRYDECCGVAGRTAQNTHITATIILDGITDGDNLTPELLAALASVSESPDLFLARLDLYQGKAWFVKMSQRWFRESVFLDPVRIPGKCVIETDLPWLEAMAAQVTPAITPVIFHTAFCGSTLMSQALQVLYNCLSLREPELLGNLLVYARSDQASDADKQQWIETGMRQLARAYNPSQIVVAKANDFSNPLMPYLVRWQSQLPMLFMYTPLNEFLVACLKAKNRHDWIRQRYHVTRHFVPALLNLPDELSIGEDDVAEMAAIYWSYNIALYQSAWKAAPGQLRSLEFTTMLDSPLAAIEACGQWFGLEALPDVDKTAETDQLFGVYSKDSTFKYSPERRENDIARLLLLHKDDVVVAENLASCLLGDDYPVDGLPGSLLS